MNDQLETQLAKVVEKSLQLAERSGEFIIDQAPDLLREFYAWHLAKHILLAVICLIIVIGVIYSIRKAYKHDEDMCGVFIPVTVFGGAGGLFGIGHFFYSIYNIVFILIAPKIYLIEYFIK